MASDMPASTIVMDAAEIGAGNVRLWGWLDSFRNVIRMSSPAGALTTSGRNSSASPPALPTVSSSAGVAAGVAMSARTQPHARATTRAKVARSRAPGSWVTRRDPLKVGAGGICPEIVVRSMDIHREVTAGELRDRRPNDGRRDAVHHVLQGMLRLRNEVVARARMDVGGHVQVARRLHLDFDPGAIVAHVDERDAAGHAGRVQGLQLDDGGRCSLTLAAQDGEEREDEDGSRGGVHETSWPVELYGVMAASAPGPRRRLISPGSSGLAKR